MASDPAPPTPCTPEALSELQAIVSRSFGISDGYKELNGAISAAAGFNMFQRIGMEDKPTDLVVAKLAEEIKSEGNGPACLEALFLAYPGNFELRGWVAVHIPVLLAKVSDETFGGAREAYEKDRQERRVGFIAANISAVGAAIELDAEQQAVSRRIVALLEDLSAFKSIHDILHGLQGTVLVELDRVAADTIEPEYRRDIILDKLDDLEIARDKIENCRNEYPVLSQPSGSCQTILDNLDSVSATLKSQDQTLARTPRRAFMDLRAMLRSQMGQFDKLMVETVSAIPFHAFADMLRDLAAPAAAPPPDIADTLLTTADAIDATSRRLASRCEQHNLWQRLDAILHNVEELLWGSGRSLELEIHWEDIEGLMAQLKAINPQDISEPIALAQPIETAASHNFADMSDDLKRAFMRFIRKVRGRFQVADTALLRDCQELRRLHKPLELLLENQG